MPGRRHRQEGQEEGERRQQTSGINPLHGSKGGMTSISKTSTFDNNVPPGPRASPASLGARCRKRAGGVATTARLVQWHMGSQPEAPTARCVHLQPTSLAGTKPHSKYIYFNCRERIRTQAPGGRLCRPRTARCPQFCFCSCFAFHPGGSPCTTFADKELVASSDQNAVKSHTAEPCPRCAPGWKVDTQLAELRRLRTGSSW